MTAVAAPRRTLPSVKGVLDNRTAQGLTGVVGLIVVLELMSRTGIIPTTVLPAASQVLAEIPALLAGSGFRADVLATMQAWAIGLGIAVLVAVPIGLLLGSFRLAYAASQAAIEFLRPIPSVALVPLGVLVLGLSLEMKVSLVVYASIWPIIFNTIYGVRDIEKITKETAQTFRIPWNEMLIRVLLPAAAPFAFTGIRISASIALIVAISAELLAGTPTGIGSFIMRVSASGGSMAVVLAATIVAGVLGVLVNLILRLIERRVFRWKEVSHS